MNCTRRHRFRSATLGFVPIFLVFSASAMCAGYPIFDDIGGPEVPQQELAEARVPSVFGYPKFKSVTYVYVEAGTANPQKEAQFKDEIFADDGLMRIRLEFPPIGIDRLAGFGGMVVFKSRGLGPYSDGRVSIAENMHVVLPSLPLQVGARTEISYDSPVLPKTLMKSPSHFYEACEATRVLEAKEIFRSLTGRAVEMVCKGRVPTTGKDYVTYKVYLDDLGLVVPATKAIAPSVSVTRFVSFDVEK